MEEKTVLINNLKVNFKVAGQGPAVLILHGWGSSSASWSKVQELLSAKGYRVICPDFPGFGKSKPPKKAWSVTDYTNWTFNFTKSQKLDKFFILAHSFGGRIAVKFVVEFPEMVKALILCDSAGIKRKPDFKTKTIFLVSKMGNALFGTEILAKFKGKARDVFYTFLRHKDYVRASGVMKETIKKVLEEDLSPYLLKINTRTLTLWGEKDKTVPIEDAHTFKDKIKDSQLKILRGVAHSPHLQAPQKLIDIILNFLQTL